MEGLRVGKGRFCLARDSAIVRRMKCIYELACGNGVTPDWVKIKIAMVSCFPACVVRLMWA